MRGTFLLLSAVALFWGCGSKPQARRERLVSPVQQDMGGMKGYDMPRTHGTPMPAGWKGFKAY